MPPLTLVSAAHGLIEAVSALRRLALRGELTAAEGADAVAWLGSLDLLLDPTSLRASRIWALRDRMSAYDAAYAAAAEAFGAALVTVDRRLMEACRAVPIPAVALDDLAPPPA